MIESAATSPASSVTAQFQAFCAEAVDCPPASGETTSSDESQNQFADAPNESSIPGSDYRTVDRQLDPDKGPLQSAEPDLVSQEATSRSRSASQVDKDRRDFQAKAAVPPKKEPRGSVFLGILVILFGVVFVSTGLVMVGFEISSIPAQISALVLGAAAPLVCARGRNAAVGTVICTAVVLVAIILVIYPRGAMGIDIQVPGRPRSLLFEPQRYDFASPSVVDFLDQQKAVLCMVTQGDTSEFHGNQVVFGRGSESTRALSTV